MGKPNMILITVDDQRYGTIRALGNNDILTPNLDRLVKDGTSFVQAHIPGGTMGAICMPSRAMIHTGKNLFNWPSHGFDIPNEHTLFGEHLQSNGYQTFSTGKWHNSKESFNRSFASGEHIFFGGMWDHWNVPVSHYDPTGKYDNYKQFNINPFEQEQIMPVNCDKVHLEKHSSELFIDTAIEWIDSYEGNQPFYLNIAFMSPHDPRNAPKEYEDLYDPETIQLPKNYLNEHPFDFGVNDIRDELLLPTPRNEEDVKRHIAQYYAMISHHDAMIGRLINQLEEKNVYDDTIIVFVADHGLSLGQHGLLGKQNTYDYSVRVPLIFKGPNIPKNEVRENYVYHFDLFPTICELLGISIPESVEGKSMVSIMENMGVNTRETLYFAYDNCIRGVKNDTYKLIEYVYENALITQLFDLKNDPDEMVNLSDDGKYHSLIENLKEEMEKYAEEWNEKNHPKGKEYWQSYHQASRAK